VTCKGLVASCHSFYFNYFSISSLLTPRIGPPYGGAGAEIELLAVQQADALLSELRRTLSELCRTVSELRRTLSDLRRTLSDLRRTLSDLRRTLSDLRRTL
jgi:hypothetical protein